MKNLVTEKLYNKALADVYAIMQKGEKNITDKEAQKLTSMAAAIQNYEKVHYPFPMPKTLVEMVELKIFEKKINKVTLAKTLGIGTPKLSQILNGKRPPDVSFLKAIHEKLGIDGNFILEAV